MKKRSDREKDVFYAHAVLLMVQEKNTSLVYSYGDPEEAKYFATAEGQVLISAAKDLAKKILHVYEIMDAPYDAPCRPR